MDTCGKTAVHMYILLAQIFVYSDFMFSSKTIGEMNANRLLFTVNDFNPLKSHSNRAIYAVYRASHLNLRIATAF
jgi:hypothetical protein